jgi:hypothetical protein
MAQLDGHGVRRPTVEAMTIVDDLLANPGLYVGTDRLTGTEHTGIARVVVTPLPGGAGVSLDYEVLNAATEKGISHAEHSILAKVHGDRTVLVVAHNHADTVQVLWETEPGVFELGPEGAPFPMKVVLSMLPGGTLRHAWWYGRPGEDAAVERDVSEVQRQP